MSMTRGECLTGSFVVLVIATLLALLGFNARGCQQDQHEANLKRYEIEVKEFGRELPNRPWLR